MGSLWNRSGVVERYADDLKAPGAQAFFFSGGTTTPLVVYQDAGESAAHAIPVVADANGRWPDVFVPYILGYDVQVKTADGVQLTYSQNIPNPDPVQLTVTPDPSADIVTGMVHAELVNTTRTGYVRLNGKTIGNASSLGTERANSDTSDLFTYLWNGLTDAIASVSGGRGPDPASDFAANKTIVLPNCQGTVLVGLDDMGATAGGFFTGLSFATGDAVTPGSNTGINSLALALSNIPAHTHSGTTATESAHTHSGTTGTESVSHTHSATTSSDGAHQHSAFIGDDQHTHGLNNNTSIYRSAGGANIALAAQAASTTVTISMDSASTGVRVRSTAGSAASADDKVASAGAHTHTVTTGNASVTHTHSFTSGAGTAHSHTFTTDSQGGGQAFNNLPRARTVTWYIKL
jgi:hypothetical protein